MTNDLEGEREFLHALSNELAKVQGKNMIASMKVHKVDPDELKTIIETTQTYIDSMIKIVKERKAKIS